MLRQEYGNFYDVGIPQLGYVIRHLDFLKNGIAPSQEFPESFWRIDLKSTFFVIFSIYLVNFSYINTPTRIWLHKIIHLMIRQNILPSKYYLASWEQIQIPYLKKRRFLRWLDTFPKVGYVCSLEGIITLLKFNIAPQSPWKVTTPKEK